MKRSWLKIFIFVKITNSFSLFAAMNNKLDPSQLKEGEDYYLTITESKKKFTDDGKFVFEKHKLFLYKEDFEKFKEGLDDVLEKINDLNNQ